MTVVARTLRSAAERFGDRVAVWPDGGPPVTYAALWDRAAAAGAALQAKGFGAGAVVALDRRSDVDWVVLHAAVSAIGGTVAGVNPKLTAAEKAPVLDRLRPDLVLTEVPDGSGVVVVPEPDPARVTTVVFTSGTTGEPKGAVFTERHLEAIMRIDLGIDPSSDEAGWGTGGPMLVSTQFNHIGVSTKLAWYLRTGSTMHVLPRWRPADALRLTAEHRIPSVGGVAAHIGLLLREPDFDRYDLSAVKTIVIGGGPSPAALVEEARRRFGAAYSIRYSSTESGGVGTGTAFDADDEEALHTVGRPRPGVEIRIDDRTGELLLRSDAVMARYWNDPERTAAALDEDGWLRTGDLGTIDERGLLRLTGRATDMYIRGGYNVHPAEVEAVLLAHPAVQAVAVVPRPDEVLGERGVAVVMVAPGEPAPTAAELRAYAGARLAGYKLPDDVVVVDEIPLTTMDKVDRRALARLAVAATAAGGER